MLARIHIALLLLLVVACTDRPAPPTPRQAPVASVVTATPAAPAAPAATAASAPVWHTAAGLRVLEVEVGEHDAALPMVVFIHGRGDIANTGWIDGFDTRGRYLFPQAPIPYGDGYSWFTYSARGDATALARDIASMATQLSAAIRELSRTRPTLGKVVVSGFSQGGMLSYALALLHPEQVALAIPLSGMLPAPLYREVPKTGVHYAPIRALHGMADTLVPYADTEHMVQELRGRGLDIELSSYEGVRHTLSMAMRSRLYGLLREAIATQAQALRAQ